MSNIFIAEDNYPDAVLLREALKESGVVATYEVAEDGEKAIRRLREVKNQKPPLDLIVLDINLPRVPGPDVLSFIRADRYLKNIPTVMVTSSNAAIDRARCTAADAYFLKCSDWDDCLRLAQRLAEFINNNNSSKIE